MEVGTSPFVYVVDDDPAVRRSLERLLDAVGFRVTSYATPKAFLGVAEDLALGCVLLDLRMPEMDGFEVQARLLLINPGLPVIVITAEGDVQSAVRAMKAGAVDFIEKPCSDETLISAIESALRGIGMKGRTEDIAAAAVLIGTLSPREREVLEALVAGQPNKVIAFRLGISVRTVEVHRSRMMERLGVRQLGQAVKLSVLASLAEGG
ncbi:MULTISPECIES: response regulator [Agrobacterium]|uniref:Two-component system response regulator FixJ n=1 Tax=Agrobacterium larrymoorei TaxID=160699 RepID=A0AAJ2BAG6_9HYPH|nr:response regulator [Agrobacterium larrymoorei]MDQ1183694.1 two-component system response regulator FixJ [Agrobacterium larrymoorei]MDQ1195464.1 two-component system response regulator FixJ [Rhizobium sp. SORGH_AS_0787]MDR6100967.1 two-component system response regulator FixJ [Agrobacterium larrymoorei]